MVFVLAREKKGFLYNIEKIYICGNEGMRHKTRKWEKKVKLEKENERDSEMGEKDKRERIWRMKERKI